MTIQEAIRSNRDFYRRKWLEQFKDDNPEIDTQEWAIQELDMYTAKQGSAMDEELWGITPEDILADDWEVKEQ